MHQKVLIAARSIAAMLDGEKQRNIRTRSDEGSASYAETLSLLRRARDEDRSDDFLVKDIQTIVPQTDRSAKLVFGVDIQKNFGLGNHAGDEVPPDMKVRLGRNRSDDDFSPDADDVSVLSAFAPILDGAGKPVGELEVDATQESLQLPLNGSRTRSLVTFAATAIFSIVLCAFLAQRFSKPLDSLVEAFKGYIPEADMRAILAGQPPALRGARRVVTVLFADIRDFTSTSENMRPEDVVGQLSEFFEAMVEVVIENQGYVDKFLGDGFMALFGMREDESAGYQQENAVRAATKMQLEVKRLSEKWQKEGRKPLRMGIGINSGLAIVGNIGSRKRFEYTAIGNTVNLAQRLEAATKELGVEILVSASTREVARPAFGFGPAQDINVKGWDEPLRVYPVTPS